MHVTLTLMFGFAKNREMGFKTFENAMASHPARQNISEKRIVCLAKQPTN